jgi:hypothetical protein
VKVGDLVQWLMPPPICEAIIHGPGIVIDVSIDCYYMRTGRAKVCWGAFSLWVPLAEIITISEA